MLIITTTATAMTLFAIALLLPAATSVPQPGHRSLQLQRDQAFEDTVIIPTGIEWGKHVQPSITAHASSVDGHTTYSLELTPVGNAETIYALYGHPQVALEMPPAYHVAAPFGTNFGGTPTPLLTLRAEAQFDSFLFAAESFGKLGSVGIDFDSWTSDHGLSSNNGAVFYADPNDAVAGRIVAAQLTVPAGSGFTAQMGAQGHNAIDPVYQATLAGNPRVREPDKARESWNQEYVQFSMTAAPMPTGH